MKKPKVTRRMDAPWEVSCEQYEFKSDAAPKGNAFWAKSDDLIRLLENTGTVSHFDFHSALGDTILEKYESVYLHMLEINNVILRKVPPGGYFWIATNKNIASFFETMPGFTTSQERKFGPYPFDRQYVLESIEEVQDIGTINNRWRLFMCEKIPPTQMLIGLDNYEHDPVGYARINMANFII